MKKLFKVQVGANGIEVTTHTVLKETEKTYSVGSALFTERVLKKNIYIPSKYRNETWGLDRTKCVEAVREALKRQLGWALDSANSLEEYMDECDDLIENYKKEEK